MDDIVKQAMAKWPNVPHCYGWLALDARGTWRMRDEAAQRADAIPGRPPSAATSIPESSPSTASLGSATSRPNAALARAFS